ncbi:MAG: GntR family transcriptional regulator [Arachnia sp.]
MNEPRPRPDASARSLRGRPAESLQDAIGAITIPTTVRTRISDLVYEELSEAIRDLRLPPGTPLSEPAVATWLHVSRAPVREAFTRLADQQLITIVPQVGSQVAPISLSGVEEAVFIRYALERTAFERAVTLGEVSTETLQEAVDRNRRAALDQDAETFFDSDEQIHQLLFAVAGVEKTWHVVRSTKLQLDRLRRINLSAALVNAEVLEEHQEIVDALQARDAERGARVIHRHSHRILGDTSTTRTDHPEFFVP